MARTRAVANPEPMMLRTPPGGIGGGVHDEPPCGVCGGPGTVVFPDGRRTCPSCSVAYTALGGSLTLARHMVGFISGK
jgi:hypothetical protein